MPLLPLECLTHIMGYIEHSKTAHMFKYIVMNREERREYELRVYEKFILAIREVEDLIQNRAGQSGTELEPSIFTHLSTRYGSSIFHEVALLNEIRLDYRPPVLYILLELLHSKKRWSTIEKELKWRVSIHGRLRLIAFLYLFRYTTQSRRSRSLRMIEMIISWWPGRRGRNFVVDYNTGHIHMMLV